MSKLRLHSLLQALMTEIKLRMEQRGPKSPRLLPSGVEAVLKVIIMLLRYSSVEGSQEGCAEVGISEYLGQTLKSCYYRESHGYINC